MAIDFRQMDRKKHKVALIEDDPVFSAYLTGALRKSGFECMAIIDFEQELYLDDAIEPDVFIVDYHLGSKKRNGLTVCKQIMEVRDIPVIMLTAEQSTKVLVECLEAGAEQYINKPCSIEELVARINVVLRAEKGLKERASAGSEKPMKVEQLELSRQLLTLAYGEQSVSLTQREFELAELLLSKPGGEWSRDEIFRQLFGFEMPPFSRAVDVVITRLRKKLALLSDDIQLVSIRNRGYSLHL